MISQNALFRYCRRRRFSRLNASQLRQPPSSSRRSSQRKFPQLFASISQQRIEQWWARQDQKGPVFLLNVTSVDEAHTLLEALPLGQAKLMEFEYIELTPLTPLHMLLTEGWANG